jgi:hypothetical protein
LAALLAVALQAPGSAVESVIQDIGGAAGTERPVIHIVLDEHASPSALPDDLFSAAEKERVFAPLAARGFMIFDHALSQDIQTHLSLTRLFNEQADPTGKVRRRPGGYMMMEASGLAAVARKRKLSVTGADWLRLDAALGHIENVSSYHNAALYRPQPTLARLDARWEDRLLVFRSVVVSWMRSRQKVPLAIYLLPTKHPRTLNLTYARSKVFAANSKIMFDQLGTELRDSGKRGHYYLAHFLLPHYPYVFHPDCTLRPAREWRENRPMLAFHTRESRREHYRLYFDQLQCAQRTLLDFLNTIDTNPALRDATIIVHGDHGSRIGLPRRQWETEGGSPEQHERDYHGTFLAVRTPGVLGGRRADVVTIGDIYGRLVASNFTSTDPVD